MDPSTSNNHKWLVSFFESITLVQWFFIATGAITILFIKLMMDYYDRTHQSNFKKGHREDGNRTKVVKKP